MYSKDYFIPLGFSIMPRTSDNCVSCDIDEVHCNLFAGDGSVHRLRRNEERGREKRLERRELAERRIG